VRGARRGLICGVAAALAATAALGACGGASNAGPGVPDLFGRSRLVRSAEYTVDNRGHVERIGPAQLVMGTRTVRVPRGTPIYSWCNFIDTGYEHCYVQVGLHSHTSTAEWIAAFEQIDRDGPLPYLDTVIRGATQHRLVVGDGIQIPLTARLVTNCDMRGGIVVDRSMRGSSSTLDPASRVASRAPIACSHAGRDQLAWARSISQ
jgi:hypothetical protein